MRFAPIGEAGQRRLLQARATLVGCGALGSVLADTLVRAGLGFLRIVDRDVLELSNLQRQVLFDEQDVADGLPKAVAAQRKLARINSAVTVEGVVEDVRAGNIETLTAGSHLVLDGTDNFETRYLINDLAVSRGTPWIYGACVSASGLVMPVVPGRTPCLRCVFEQAPPPELSPTCDTAGVIAPAVGVVAGLQAAEALKLLTGNEQAVRPHIIQVDLWSGRLASVDLAGMPEGASCPCCGRREFEYLQGRAGQTATTLCGRDAVQINPLQPRLVDLDVLQAKLAGLAGEGGLRRNEFMLQVDIGGHQLTVFPSGRVIVKGTTRPDEARTVCARYIGV
jgi:adenylyltransferase/sulfurtransferase